jgi:hypothetical protein
VVSFTFQPPNPRGKNPRPPVPTGQEAGCALKSRSGPSGEKKYLLVLPGVKLGHIECDILTPKDKRTVFDNDSILRYTFIRHDLPPTPLKRISLMLH